MAWSIRPHRQDANTRLAGAILESGARAEALKIIENNVGITLVGEPTDPLDEFVTCDGKMGSRKGIKNKRTLLAKPT